MNIGEWLYLVSNTSCLTLQMTVVRLTLNERHGIYEFSLNRDFDAALGVQCRLAAASYQPWTPRRLH